jgi:hypothetical protein
VYGKRIVEIAPSLIQAKSVNEVAGILTVEFEKHKEEFVKLAEDPDTKDKAVAAMASFINAGINYVQVSHVIKFLTSVIVNCS